MPESEIGRTEGRERYIGWLAFGRCSEYSLYSSVESPSVRVMILLDDL